MDQFDSPAVWGIIWLGLAASLIIGELLIVGTLFLAPFAAGALAAGLASFLHAPPALSLAVFFLVSIGSYYLLRPLSRKLEIDTPNPVGVGANRLIGLTGEVLDQIPLGLSRTGLVRIGGEKWNAEGRDGMGISVGTAIRIIEVKGTRVIVEPSVESGIIPTI